jgi:membrane-associated phospholipid phosphatase
MAWRSQASKSLVDRWRMLRPEDAYHIVYLGITGAIVLANLSRVPQAGAHLLARVAIVAGIFVIVPAARRQPTSFAAVVAGFYHVPLLPWYYRETAVLHAAAWGGHTFDDVVASWDLRVFGSEPSIEFPRAMPQLWFAEAMQLSYVFYYVLALGTGVLLWFRKSRPEAFERTMHAVVLTMIASCLWFVAMPVMGPQFAIAEVAMRELPGIVGKSAHTFVRMLDEPTGAFPSTHVSLTVVFVLGLRRYAPAMLWLVLLPSVGVAASTVYVGAHYGVDVPAGLAMGVVGFLIAQRSRDAIAKLLGLRAPSSSPTRTTLAEPVGAPAQAAAVAAR